MNVKWVFENFASDPEFQEVDRKRLKNSLKPMLKFEGLEEDEECSTGEGGLEIFDNVKSAVAILEKPVRVSKASRI